MVATPKVERELIGRTRKGISLEASIRNVSITAPSTLAIMLQMFSIVP